MLLLTIGKEARDMPGLSSNSGKILLDLACTAIKSFCLTGDHPALNIQETELQIRRGVFVTLRKDGNLRGCVGTLDYHRFLCDNTARMAVAAAFQDHRFPAVSREELSLIRIEVSVLGELQPVSSLNEIEIGKHGIYVCLGDRSGTFLPEVALEKRWQIPEFVTFCAREKAGLKPEECAKAEIFRYEVEKFKEEDMKGK